MIPTIGSTNNIVNDPGLRSQSSPRGGSSMIVDGHRHLWSLFERYASARTLAAAGGVMGISAEPAPTLDVAARAATIRAEMVAAGVDHTVLLLADYGLQLGEPPLGIEAENRMGSDL